MQISLLVMLFPSKTILKETKRDLEQTASRFLKVTTTPMNTVTTICILAAHSLTFAPTQRPILRQQRKCVCVHVCQKISMF